MINRRQLNRVVSIAEPLAARLTHLTMVWTIKAKGEKHLKMIEMMNLSWIAL